MFKVQAEQCSCMAPHPTVCTYKTDLRAKMAKQRLDID